jgi:hypothetical protein
MVKTQKRACNQISLKIYICEHGPRHMGLWPKTTISEHDLIPVGLILVATLILSQVLKEYVNSKTKQKSDTYYFFSIDHYGRIPSPTGDLSQGIRVRGRWRRWATTTLVRRGRWEGGGGRATVPAWVLFT